jgi:hypothetical protein
LLTSWTSAGDARVFSSLAHKPAMDCHWLVFRKAIFLSSFDLIHYSDRGRGTSATCQDSVRDTSFRLNFFMLTRGALLLGYFGGEAMF